MKKLGILLIVLAVCLPAYSQVLVYSVTSTVRGVSDPVEGDLGWGTVVSHGYLVADADLSGEAELSLILYGRDDNGNKAFEVFELGLDEFYPVNNSPYTFTAGVYYDNLWLAILTGYAREINIGGGTALVAQGLTGHILIFGDLPLSENDAYGSGIVAARLKLTWTRQYNKEELSFGDAVDRVIEYLENKGYTEYGTI